MAFVPPAPPPPDFCGVEPLSIGVEDVTLEDAPITRTDCSFLTMQWGLRLRTIIRAKQPKESFFIGDTDDDVEVGEQVLCSGPLEEDVEEVTTDTEHYWENMQYYGPASNTINHYISPCFSLDAAIDVLPVSSLEADRGLCSDYAGAGGVRANVPVVLSLAAGLGICDANEGGVGTLVGQFPCNDYGNSFAKDDDGEGSVPAALFRPALDAVACLAEGVLGRDVEDAGEFLSQSGECELGEDPLPSPLREERPSNTTDSHEKHLRGSQDRPPLRWDRRKRCPGNGCRTWGSKSAHQREQLNERMGNEGP